MVEQSLFEATICFVAKLDRLGRDLRHLVNKVHDLTARGIGFKVLSGHGASIDTTFPGGKLVFGVFAALADFERELIIERTKAGMATARARGRNGGRPYKMTPSKLRLAVASMNQPKPGSAICAPNSALFSGCVGRSDRRAPGLIAWQGKEPLLALPGSGHITGHCTSISLPRARMVATGATAVRHDLQVHQPFGLEMCAICELCRWNAGGMKVWKPPAWPCSSRNRTR